MPFQSIRDNCFPTGYCLCSNNSVIGSPASGQEGRGKVYPNGSEIASKPGYFMILNMVMDSIRVAGVDRCPDSV